jgi:hypothetical protein
MQMWDVMRWQRKKFFHLEKFIILLTCFCCFFSSSSHLRAWRTFSQWIISVNNWKCSAFLSSFFRQIVEIELTISEFSASSRAVLVQITPVLGVLVGIVLTLILLAIFIVIFVKVKNKVRKWKRRRRIIDRFFEICVGDEYKCHRNCFTMRNYSFRFRVPLSAIRFFSCFSSFPYSITSHVESEKITQRFRPNWTR